MTTRLSDLSPEQRRLLLAEAAGWTCCGMGGCEYKIPYGLQPYRKISDYSAKTVLDGEVPLDPLPSFDTDLNAVADLEAKLTDEQYEQFCLWLEHLASGDPKFRAVSAPANLRVSALVLTLVEGMEL